MGKALSVNSIPISSLPTKKASSTGSVSGDDIILAMKTRQEAEDKAKTELLNGGYISEHGKTKDGRTVYAAKTRYNSETLRLLEQYYVFKERIIVNEIRDTENKGTGKFVIQDKQEPGDGSWIMTNVFVRVEKTAGNTWNICNAAFVPEDLKKVVDQSMEYYAQNAQVNEFSPDPDSEANLNKFLRKNYGTHKKVFKDVNGATTSTYTDEIFNSINKRGSRFSGIRDTVITNFRNFAGNLANKLIAAGICGYDIAVKAVDTLVDYFTNAIDAVMTITTDDENGGNCSEDDTHGIGDFMYHNYVTGKDEHSGDAVTKYIASGHDRDVNQRKDFAQLDAIHPESTGILIGCNNYGRDQYNIMVDIERMIELFMQFCKSL